MKVYVNPKHPEKVKYASAHDFRRAFGVRWAARLMPAQLMELMRHESIETTLRFMSVPMPSEPQKLPGARLRRSTAGLLTVLLTVSLLGPPTPCCLSRDRLRKTRHQTQVGPV